MTREKDSTRPEEVGEFKQAGGLNRGIGVAFSGVMKAAALAGVAFVGILATVPAQAESLADAMRAAYRNNPTLNADRARQRVDDEQVPAAKSGWRPTVSARATAQREWSDNSNLPYNAESSLGFRIELTQPVFRGFRTVEGVKAAKSAVEAGRQQLLATEQQVLFDVANAYLSVVRFRQILAIQQKNVGNLQKQARAAQSRFEVGEVTRTDVSQARARVSGAQGDVASSKADLEASIAAYIEVVGSKPGKLKYSLLGKIPESLEAALAKANDINPLILSASWAHDASLHSVEVQKGALLPTLNLKAIGAYTVHPQDGTAWSESATVQAILDVPIYQGGAEYSAIREAKQLASQRQVRIIEATREVRRQVAAAWYSLISAGQSITAAKAQVSAAALALDGINQEYLVGSRTTIDVLNAEQEVLTARIGVVTAEYLQHIARYQLLQAMGKLTAKHVGLGGAYYDPKANYNRVKDKWIGHSISGE